MTEDEYQDSMNLLASQAGILALLPLEHMLETVERAESVGFLFVPPLEYVRGLDNLKHQRRLLEAALEMKKLVQEMRDTADEEEVRTDPSS